MHRIAYKRRVKPSPHGLRYNPRFFGRMGSQAALFTPLFGPGRSGKARDYSRNFLDGAIASGVTFSGSALSFPGTETSAANVVNFGTSSALNPSNITLFARFKADSTKGSATWQQVIGRGSAFIGWSYMLVYNGNDLRFYCVNSGVFAVLSGIGKDKWITAVGTYNGSTIKLFGKTDSGSVLTASASQSGALTVNSLQTSLGRGGNGSGFANTDCFGGLIESAGILPVACPDNATISLLTRPWRTFTKRRPRAVQAGGFPWPLLFGSGISCGQGAA